MSARRTRSRRACDGATATATSYGACRLFLIQHVPVCHSHESCHEAVGGSEVIGEGGLGADACDNAILSLDGADNKSTIWMSSC